MKFLADNIFLIGIAFLSGGMLIYPYVMRKAGGASVNTLEATQLINKGAALLDVREPAERVSGHISEAKHIPLAQLETKIADLEKLKSKPVVVYCATGSRSGRAAAQLRKAGFSEVYNLEGGIAAWRAAGLPVTK